MKNKKSNIDNLDFQYGKLPPQAIELEYAVLGALLQEPEEFKTVSSILNVQSFYKEENQLVFEIISTLFKERKRIDLLTVTQEAKDRNLLDEVGGPGFITGLTRTVANANNIEHHARIIADKYALRKIITLANEIQKKAYGNNDTDEVILEIKKALNDVEDIYTVADTGSHIKSVLKETIIQIQEKEIRQKENRTPGISTGFPSLNITTGGWRNGNLIVLASRPSVGKTSLNLHFALEAAKAGFWVNIFSLEMLKEDLAEILISGESDVYRGNIHDGYLDKHDWQKINQGIARLENLPIIFKDSSGMNISQVEAIIRANRKKRRCDFVVVDYLQLLRSIDKKTIREQEIAEISRTLKTIALENQIPVMALSQLNRIEANEEPGLINLRESGAIEQDADLVCFLYRPDTDNSITLSIAKHRRGKLAQMKIYHNGQMTRFSEKPFDENYTPEPDERIESKKSIPF